MYFDHPDDVRIITMNRLLDKITKLKLYKKVQKQKFYIQKNYKRGSKPRFHFLSQCENMFLNFLQKMKNVLGERNHQDPYHESRNNLPSIFFCLQNLQAIKNMLQIQKSNFEFDYLVNKNVKK